MLSSSAHLPGTSSMGANGKKTPPHANGSSQQNGNLNGHNSNGSNSPNGTSSHAGSYQQQLLHNNYAYENQCLRCGQVVYQVDKIGPLKDFTFFHQGCFKCQACGTKLTLKTYYNNQNDQEDKEVYCQSHVPKTGPGKLDGLSVGIKAALRAPRTNHLVNEQIRGLPGSGTPGTGTSSSPTSNGNGISKSSTSGGSRPPVSLAGRFDASALHIQHGLNATKLQSQYRPPVEHAKIEEFLDEEIQRKLEMRHREEEDALYRQFARKRAEEESQISAQIREEWEEELQKLTSRLTSHNSSLTKERAHLEKNMTIKLDRRKETLTRKLLEQERAATAELVDKQSQEMIKLISEKLFEYQQASGVPVPSTLPSSAVTTTASNVTISQTSYIEPVRSTGLNEAQKLRRPQSEPSAYPASAPSPSPPALRKSDLYEDPSVFEQIDEVAINVANQDQRTFTDLVRLLIAPCETDVQKARAIFRWITVKNLNTMEFDEHVNADTPMGILRGIKHGTESYHVLFKRLCAYAGLHCVVIKGYSKSAGYQPGVRFEDARFRNSWNAVYVAGGWRFVQCNWGARHLVNAKEIPRPGARGRSDSLRYEYDDHYFLTDPAQFVYEFYPLQHEWQLLRSAITLAEFEQLPFVRSLFFRYGLYFPSASGSSSGGGGCRAVLHTDSSGAATVRIGMPARLTPNLIFHYNLKYMGEREVGEESDEHEGTSLKRYVMQSVSGNVVSFRVHAPTAGQYIMDIFANATSPREYVTGEPMKFKSVCKFRLVASDLQTVMVPLPACASGEWGPLKASRLFGLVSLTHDEALIFATSATLEVAFRMSRPLSDFMASLHRNGYDEKRLSKLVSCTLDGEIVTFVLRFPEDGQYGLDIYTREPRVATAGDKQLLTHCCKYLINVALKN